MRIMTLNLNFCETKHGPWPVRRKLIVQVVQDHSPDVIAFQAVRMDPASEHRKDQASQLADDMPEFKHVTFVAATTHPDGTQDGSAFLSRVPFKHVEHRVLRLGAETNQAEDPASRIVLLVQVEPPSLSIFNCHYSWASRQALSNIDEALNYMRDYRNRAVLVGDLNNIPESDLLGRLAVEGWIDAWAYLRPRDSGYTFESNAPDKRIDYVWVKPDLVPSLKSIDLVKEPSNQYGARLSDHLGLIVTLA
jgi:endonuclease/exonuclease/phosphatase family metal-dependent hydrolase